MWIESRAPNPLLPLHIVRDRARGGAYASIALAGSGVFGVFLFLTYYMQESLGFSPLKTGVAFLPLTIAIVITSTTVQTQLVHRYGARRLVAGGMALGVAAMVSFTRLSPGGTYTADVLPGLIVIGLGMGFIFAPAFSTATLGVASTEAGVASATVNTSQQVGGSIGTALLSTIFASAAASYAAAHTPSRGLVNAAAIHGYTTAFWWAAAVFAVGLLVALTVLPSPSAGTRDSHRHRRRRRSPRGRPPERGGGLSRRERSADGPCRNRTCNLGLKRPLLCRLS